MASAIQRLVTPGQSPAQPPGSGPPAPPPPPISSVQYGFFKDYLRVYTGPFILFALVIYCLHIHADDKYTAGSFGALIALLQSQRFKW